MSAMDKNYARLEGFKTDYRRGQAKYKEDPKKVWKALPFWRKTLAVVALGAILIAFFAAIGALVGVSTMVGFGLLAQHFAAIPALGFWASLEVVVGVGCLLFAYHLLNGFR